MDLNLYTKKFNAFRDYQSKLPGIGLGLKVLSNLNVSINSASPSNENNSKQMLVNFYDYENNSLKELNLIDLNLKLQDIYMYVVYFNRKINENKLYSNLFLAYDKVYSKYNYGYYNNSVFTKYDMINKFLQGLRKDFSKNAFNKQNQSYWFDLGQVIRNFDKNLFDETVSAEKFLFFWVDFIVLLKQLKIINFNVSENSFNFKSEYQFELLNIMYFSFDLMILGNNKVYEVYDLTNDDVESNLNKIYTGFDKRPIESQFYTNDLLVSLVLSSCVSQICAPKNINNIFIETLDIIK